MVRGVPVVMYHGVGPVISGWVWNYLNIPISTFEGQIRILKEKGWATITLTQLYNHMVKGDPLPDKPIVLTFDDGYLNNWVNAYPILKKYGYRAVIWMSTDFVDPHPVVRPTLEDVWQGRLHMEELPTAGFLSWKEMKIMVESNVVEIQSHAKTHTWYFSGTQIIDFHRPTGAEGYIPYLWLAWNLFPERKFEYMTANLEKHVPYGTPVYAYHKSLNGRRYFEDKALTRRLVQHVADCGEDSFFARADWRNELMSIVEKYPPKDDRFESNVEYEDRVREELIESQRTIEEILGTSVKFLCWPGGAFNRTTLRIAEEVGYVATTMHYQGQERRNIYGQNPREINRIGCGTPWKWRGLRVFRTDPGFFLAVLNDFKGDRSSIWKMRLYKLKYAFRHYLFGTA